VKEENLIFIISQPRSGSTFLQKIISNNSKVATSSEPWILFPFALFYRPDLHSASFDGQTAHSALEEFLTKFNAKEDLKDSLKSIILSLYEKAMGDSKYFLDKTPRYYEILPQLVNWFPKAHFLVLKRNPLAVLASMIDTWSGGKLNYKELIRFERDFMIAPTLIQNFCSDHQRLNNFYEVKYESLVKNPEYEVRKIYRWLGIDFNLDALQFGRNTKVTGKFGDDVYKSDRDSMYKEIPIEMSADKWMEKLNRRSLKSFLSGYYWFLGEEFMKNYGYNIDSGISGSLNVNKEFFNQFIYLQQKNSSNTNNIIDLLKYKLLKKFSNRIKEQGY
jgi:hypothetical protein